MTDYGRIEKHLTTQLSLTHRPVAVAFLKEAPVGIDKFEGVQPSGCSFWTLASEGRTFYTVAADHYNCPIGSHTHNIPLPAERARELDDTIGFMTSIGYLRMEEVPAIPRLADTPGVVVYAPLAATPVDPDVVLFWGPPGKVMLLQEAAIRAGAAARLDMLGRPTCMAVPAALSHGAVASTGCIGNRVYTGLDESELYVAVPGRDLQRIADETATITSANATLLAYHEGRKRELARV
ncbi:MAG: hypothetical protein EXQ53_05825 [Acidobacteria bacterium]|nr:hypothetical protein [Acidobacteriota bacterium]